MAYEPLPIIEVSLDNVQLDLKNYRIPTRQTDEESAMKYLFASEDVIGAAKMILRDGYFDNEVPIVTKHENDSYIVLEGNRRVSALKALIDPSIIASHESEIRALLKRYAIEAENLPKMIRVLVSPDRASAAPHIARLHTGTSKKKWSRDQQATFYYSLLDGQTTVDDVRANYPGVSVARFIKMAEMRKFVAAVPFVDKSLREFAASDSLKMSTFEYVYGSKSLAETFGVSFNKDGLLEPVSTTPEQKAKSLTVGQIRVLEFIVNEFRSGRLNTRSLRLKKDSEEHSVFIRRMQTLRDSDGANGDAENGGDSASGSEDTDNPKEAPDAGTSKKASNEAGSDGDRRGSGTKRNEDAGDGKSGRGPNHPDTKKKLDLTGVPYENAPIGLKKRYFELRQISVIEFPISAVMLMRSILETSIKSRYEASGGASGELKAAFRKVKDEFANDKSMTASINAINDGKAEKPGSIAWFNMVAHDPNMTLRPEDVRSAWEKVMPVLRRLLYRMAEEGVQVE